MKNSHFPEIKGKFGFGCMRFPTLENGEIDIAQVTKMFDAFIDAGFNYFGDDRDKQKKEFVSGFPFVTFCIHGNHEMRPADVAGYITKEFCGGIVLYEEAFPNILFAKDGEVYDFGGLS